MTCLSAVTGHYSTAEKIGTFQVTCQKYEPNIGIMEWWILRKENRQPTETDLLPWIPFNCHRISSWSSSRIIFSWCYWFGMIFIKWKKPTLILCALCFIILFLVFTDWKGGDINNLVSVYIHSSQTALGSAYCWHQSKPAGKS